MAKLELESTILVGGPSKDWLNQFTAQVDRLEGLLSKTQNISAGGASLTVKPAAKKKQAAPPPVEEESDEMEMMEEDDSDLAETPANHSSLADEVDADEDEEEVDFVSADEEAEEAPAPKKKAAEPKAKKITVTDCNTAAKNKAKALGGGDKGRNGVLALIKKHFKTTSISALKPEQYSAFMKVMAV